LDLVEIRPRRSWLPVEGVRFDESGREMGNAAEAGPVDADKVVATVFFLGNGDGAQ
jgi:hypothetical protein